MLHTTDSICNRKSLHKTQATTQKRRDKNPDDDTKRPLKKIKNKKKKGPLQISASGPIRRKHIDIWNLIVVCGLCVCRDGWSRCVTRGCVTAVRGRRWSGLGRR